MVRFRRVRSNGNMGKRHQTASGNTCPLSGSVSSKAAFSYGFRSDKMKRTYRPMSNLVRRGQEKYFFRLKTAVNYGTVKRQTGAEVSRLEVSSLEGFLFRSQQVT